MNNTLVVCNLPLSIDASDLEDMFTVVGNVVTARVEFDPESGTSLGRGSVEMATREEAENCVLHFNQQAKQGQRLAVFLKGIRYGKPAMKKKRGMHA